MAVVTITISDTLTDDIDTDDIDIKLESKPAIPGKGRTFAQDMALLALDAMAKAGEVKSVRTNGDDSQI
jgi:hypothetical protein